MCEMGDPRQSRLRVSQSNHDEVFSVNSVCKASPFKYRYQAELICLTKVKMYPSDLSTFLIDELMSVAMV